jgi:chromosome segregation ATPase
LAFLATTSGSSSKREFDPEKVFSDLSRSNIESCLSESLGSYQKLRQKFKALKRVLGGTIEECDKLEIKVSELKDDILILKREKESINKQCLKLEESLSQAPQTSNTIIYEYENVFQKFLKNGIVRSRMASMIYGVSQNKKRGIGYDSNE